MKKQLTNDKQDQNIKQKQRKKQITLRLVHKWPHCSTVSLLNHNKSSCSKKSNCLFKNITPGVENFIIQSDWIIFILKKFRVSPTQPGTEGVKSVKKTGGIVRVSGNTISYYHTVEVWWHTLIDNENVYQNRISWFIIINH